MLLAKAFLECRNSITQSFVLLLVACHGKCKVYVKMKRNYVFNFNAESQQVTSQVVGLLLAHMLCNLIGLSGQTF